MSNHKNHRRKGQRATSYKDKGTTLAWLRWRRRNLLKKKLQRAARLPLRDRRKVDAA